MKELLVWSNHVSDYENVYLMIEERNKCSRSSLVITASICLCANRGWRYFILPW